jgi:type II secretory pathway component PulF
MQNKVSFLKRMQFGGKARVEVYSMLALLLENRVLLIDALREIRSVFNDDGSFDHPKDVLTVDDVKIRNIKAEAIHEWILRLKAGDKDGFALSRAMEPWVPHEEAALVLSGESTGNLVPALRDAIKSIQGKGQMMSAVLGGSIYPIVLFTAAWFVMRLFAQKVIPRFVTQIDPELWEGPAKLLYIEADLFNKYGVPVAIAAVLTVIVVVATLPFFRGSLRVTLERYLPPWNIYKMMQGSTFLKNIAVQTRAGIKLYDSVSSMVEMGSPWLRERLQAALYGIQQGQNLGEALHNAGYEFPDRRSVQILRVLASRDGFDETVYSFAERWEEETIKRVKSASSMFMAAGILAIGFVAGSCFMGMQGISSLIQDSADSVSNSTGR